MASNMSQRTFLLQKSFEVNENIKIGMWRNGH